jgi:amino acid transporter
MAAGGLLSNFSLLLVTILAQSRLPLALAEDGLFPAFVGRLHPRYGTPTASLVLGAIVLGGLCLFPFSDLAGLFSLVQVGAYLLILGSLFRLRSTPAPEAGFRIPLGRAGLAAMASPVVALALAILVRTLFPGGSFAWRPTALVLLLAASGPGSYALSAAFRRRRGMNPTAQ